MKRLIDINGQISFPDAISKQMPVLNNSKYLGRTGTH